ncbi:pantoate--beta-alanine ligase [Stakelama marina]|uniref:Pantothenate synthetase n=1 Tax=Stakelama marina TaxID=2826939 RepID=A0A8T4IIS9_9SPHN|nr:pantoate--beta-alanine ligase [Stakelama marina]MBR0553784.1 pantoate--beta-alanine ligase [Stakelama marina]
MQTIRQSTELNEHLAALRSDGKRIALVPTMGALHAGHMALVEAAKHAADHVVVSIFVNPMQFGPSEDLDRYPRREQADSRMLSDANVDVLWMPTVEEMYPDGFATTVSVGGITELYDGAARPGHFDGVATVVAKLFNQVRPDVALFGEKDYQQLAVIRKMVADLDFGIDIIGVPTQREDDGLAMSSRNIYLIDEDRKKAVALPRALGIAARDIARGGDVQAALDQAREMLTKAGFEIDYVDIVEEGTLGPHDPEKPSRLLAAARIGGTRLIDNIPVALEHYG